ncbi:MAG: hypothetical protein EOP56_08490 [Sphingobacteriales bacterium]|nr:MAG: hypothetical protein EOP56_08490 [Sphingobacteriales bacterium]
MKKLILLLILAVSNMPASSQEMNEEEMKLVSRFISYVKKQQKDQVANIVSYPLRREYPLPEIKSKNEFLKRYNELFDAALVKAISNSEPGKDWSTVGWRGIMLSNGTVWLDYDGKLIAVNNQSETETKKRVQLIAKEKKTLHPSLRTFAAPVVMLETSKYRIRVDDMGNGNYRYASWPAKRKMSSKPDLVIDKGEFIPDGSGGNYKYQFVNGAYTYDCEIIIMGEKDTPPAMLIVSQNGKQILSQKAKIVKP